MITDGCRLDAYLVREGYAGGRDKAKELILSGQVTVNSKTVCKPAAGVFPGDRVECLAPPPRFVGRGGEKLEKILNGKSLDGCTCLDVGASTGGFTDCMLQHGAKRVYAVDVGHGQLHPSLRADPRVVSLEGTNITSPSLAKTIPPGSVDFASVDVSFVSVLHILHAALSYLKPDATAVCLIKPQFEAGASALGKNGIVRDPADHIRVLKTVLPAVAAEGWSAERLTHSPITGGDGNIEYLLVISHRAVDEPPDIPETVRTAFSEMTAKKSR